MLEGKKFSKKIYVCMFVLFIALTAFVVPCIMLHTTIWWLLLYTILFCALCMCIDTVAECNEERIDKWYDKCIASSINHRRVSGVIIEKSMDQQEVLVRLSPNCASRFYLELESYCSFDGNEEVAVLVDDYYDKNGRLFRRDFVKLEKLQASAA